MDYSSETPQQTYEIGVILGKGHNHEKDQRDRVPLSQRSRLNALAGGQLYAEGKLKKLIVTGGYTSGPDLPSEAEAMKAYILKKYPTINPDDIITENESIDTPGNAEKVKGILEELQTLSGDTSHQPTIALVSNQDHIGNSETIFHTFGIPVQKTFASEEVASAITHHHKAYIDRYNRTLFRKFNDTKEVVRKGLLKADPQGKFVRRFTQMNRGGKK
jgi:uncharacterized SAM-binding protein YcdF (DUF218 family)